MPTIQPVGNIQIGVVGLLRSGHTELWNLDWPDSKPNLLENVTNTKTDNTPSEFFSDFDEICEMIQTLVAQRVLCEITYCQNDGVETWVYSEYDVPLGSTVENELDIKTSCTSRVAFENEPDAWEHYHERVAETFTAHWG